MNLLDLSSDLINLIFKNTTISCKKSSRLVCAQINNNIDYIQLRIDIFNNIFSQILIPFPVINSFNRYIQVGLLIDWNSKVTLSSYYIHKKNNNVMFIKERTYKYLGSNNISTYACNWFYDSIIDWMILEKEGIIKLK